MSHSTDRFRTYSRNGPIRLGLGDLVDDNHELSMWKARDAFLAALHETAPHVLESLTRDDAVMDQWMRLLEAIPDYANERDMESAAHAVSASGQLRSVLREVFRWARQWRLDSLWFVHIAVDMLASILEAIEQDRMEPDGITVGVPVGLSPHMIESVISPLLRAPGPRLIFAGKDYGDTDYWPLQVFPDDPEQEEMLFDWNPATESRTDNERRAVEWFTARYRAAQDARLKEAQERYPLPVQSKLYEHFIWLVQYQVSGLGYQEIARQANRSRQAVTEAIQDTARLIDLELRKSTGPGRKRANASLIDR